MDIIVVKDVPSATMHNTDNGETELVRVEWVAAVGEVKSTWYDHDEVMQSYVRIVNDMQTLQKGKLIHNNFRFGKYSKKTTFDQVSRMVTGRKWNNRCYTFLVALGQGKCKLNQLTNDLAKAVVDPSSASILILDEEKGAKLCNPELEKEGNSRLGVNAEIRATSEEEASKMEWVTFGEKESNYKCGPLLHYFVTDLQFHLDSWYPEFTGATQYNNLGPRLKF